MPRRPEPAAVPTLACAADEALGFLRLLLDLGLLAPKRPKPDSSGRPAPGVRR